MNDKNRLSRRALLGGLAATSTAVVGCGDDAPLGVDADVTLLNNLLSAEYGAIQAYEAGASVIMGAPASDPQSSFKLVLEAIANRWKAQHEAHRDQLRAQITLLRGTPVPAPTGAFMTPQGFTPTIRNVLVLACNAERGAALAYANAIGNATSSLKQGSSRGLAGSIEGDETQHFIVLYALLKQVVQPGPSIVTGGVVDVVPAAFVTRYGSMQSLQDIPDFTFP